MTERDAMEKARREAIRLRKFIAEKMDGRDCGHEEMCGTTAEIRDALLAYADEAVKAEREFGAVWRGEACAAMAQAQVALRDERDMVRVRAWNALARSLNAASRVGGDDAD